MMLTLCIDFYEELKTFADYGTAFRRVVDSYEGDNEVLILVRGDDDDLKSVNILP